MSRMPVMNNVYTYTCAYYYAKRRLLACCFL